MNIFALALEPIWAARAHCDKHVVKMIVESAQLLSTAHHVYQSKIPGMLRPTHVNHPCAVWTRACSGNYWWVSTLLYELSDEYTRRYEKVHAYHQLSRALLNVPRNIPNADRQPFVQCVPEQYRNSNAITAYRAYYRGEKKRFATWKEPATPPRWW